MVEALVVIAIVGWVFVFVMSFIANQYRRWWQEERSYRLKRDDRTSAW